MKKLFLSLILALVIVPIGARTKVVLAFPEQIIKIVKYHNFTFVVGGITGLPADVSNKLQLPESYLKVTPTMLTCQLPYFAGTARQSSYNFSSYGRMLDFETTNFNFQESDLNKRQTRYTVKFTAYADTQVGQVVTYVLSVNSDLSATLYVNWASNTVVYSGVITMN